MNDPQEEYSKYLIFLPNRFNQPKQDKCRLFMCENSDVIYSARIKR
jgi:hypothetical protein